MESMQADELREFSKHVVPRIANEGVVALQHISRSPEEILNSLFEICERPHLPSAHRIVAYSALAGFVDRGADSEQTLRELCTSENTLQRCLSIFLTRYEGHSAKPLRQLLLTVVKNLGLLEKQVSRSQTIETACRCLVPILGYEDPSGVKPAMLALEALLAKHRLVPEELLSATGRLIAKEDAAQRPEQPLLMEEALQIAQRFIAEVLKWVKLGFVAPSAGSLVVTFCKMSIRLLPIVTAATSPVWLKPVQDLQHMDDSYIEAFERHVLPDLIRLDASRVVGDLDPVLQRIRANNMASVSETDIRFCLRVLKCGRVPFKSEKPRELHGTTMASSDTLATPVVEINLLSHSSSMIRLTALDLLVSGYQLPAHLPRHVLDSILKHFPFFHTETDAHARNLFISIIKTLFSRLQISLLRLRKNMDLKAPGSQYLTGQQGMTNEDFQYSETQIAFVVQYVRFLVGELMPSASYQRHITALQVLKKLFDSGIPDDIKHCIELVSMLSELTLNAFDDIRAAAAWLLRHQTLRRNVQQFKSEGLLLLTLEKAVYNAKNILQSSGRADYADGFGRLHNLYFEISPNPCERLLLLLEELEKGLKVAETNLNHAVARAPIHGELIAIRYIVSRSDISRAFDSGRLLGAWLEFNLRLQAVFKSVWSIVHPVLCVDSPEGQSFVEDEAELDIGIKDTLSYSWRALKETSALMQALVSNAAYSRCSPSREFSREDLDIMGRLALVQLAELRHRGAFSMVAHAYAACCAACRRSEQVIVQALPEAWYEETVICIYEKGEALTRRSAGLPSMITGNLISASADTFKSSLHELQAIALQPVPKLEAKTQHRLPQVHALNSIKDICSSSKLAPAIDPYLTDILMLSTDCLESDVWPIRNCGIMLFKALLTRLTSGSGGEVLQHFDQYRRYAKASFERFPKLSQVLIRLLERSAKAQSNALRNVEHEFGFPAIQLIEKIGVLPKERFVVTNLLTIHLDAPLWIIRESAAMALSYLLSISEIIERISASVGQSQVSANTTHGFLLCLNYGLNQTQHEKTQNTFSALMRLLELHTYFLKNEMAPVVIASYLRCATRLSKLCSSTWYDGGRKPFSITSERGDSTEQLNKLLSDFELSISKFSPRYPEMTVFEAILTCQIVLRALPFVVQSENKRVIDILTKSMNQCCIAPGIRELLDIGEELDAKALCNVLNFMKIVLSHNDNENSEACLDYLCSVLDKLDMSCLSAANSEDVCTALFDITRMIAELTVTKDDVAITALQAKGAIFSILVTQLHKVFQEADCGIREWIRELHVALDEMADFPIRMAATSSIWYFRRALLLEGHENAFHSFITSLLLALAKALVDDDDEIRDKGAETVSYIMSYNDTIVSLQPTYSLPPVAARSMLQTVLTRSEFAGDPQTIDTAIRHMIGADISCDWASGSAQPVRLVSINVSESAKAVVERSMTRNTLLFVEERQNLYVDDIIEARQWAHVLESIPTNVITVDALNGLSDWVEELLTILTDHAARHVDDVMGWTCQRGTFIMGMRMFLTAKVLMTWSKTCGHDDERLFSLLKDLLEVGKRQQVNHHWIKQLEGTIASR